MTQIRGFWTRIRDSLWFLPGLMTLTAALLAWAAVALDGALRDLLGTGTYLRFSGGAEGARGVLETIAGTLITVTALVFSITIVALQLASSQFTPRILRTFTNDRANQLVLGVFIGSFTYTLLVLRTIRSADEDGEAFVPAFAVGLAIVFALLSIAFLIFYIHHAARSIRLPIILDRATRETMQAIRRVLAEPCEDSAGPPEDTVAELQTVEMLPVPIHRSGYVQVIDAAALAALARQHHVSIRVEAATGTFLVDGETIVSVWPPTLADETVADGIRGAFILGSERTTESDIEFGIRQIADIGIKALSPGVNDPTTAMICLDRLTDILVALGNRRIPGDVHRAEDGRLLLVARNVSYESAVNLAFDQIRHYGAGDPYVASYLVESLGRIAGLVPLARRRPLARQVETVQRAAHAQLKEPNDRLRVDRAVDRAAAWLGLAPAESVTDPDRRPQALRLDGGA